MLGGLNGAGNVALATAASEPVTVNVGNNGQSTTYGGVLSGAAVSAKQGAGILMLTAPSTYSGPTVISGGVLELQAAPSAAASASISWATEVPSPLRRAWWP